MVASCDLGEAETEQGVAAERGVPNWQVGSAPLLRFDAMADGVPGTVLAGPT